MERDGLGAAPKRAFQLNADPLDERMAGRWSFVQALEFLSGVLARQIPLRAAALLFPPAGAALWREGALLEGGPVRPWAELAGGLDWSGLGAVPAGALEERAKTLLPGLEPVCLPLSDGAQGGPILGLAVLARRGAWTQDDLAVLPDARRLLELTLGWRDWSRACAFQNWALNEVADSMSSGLYVTDVDTDEILFMNQAMRRMFGADDPVGKPCWQVLQKGLKHRCNFCPIPLLQEQGGDAPSCIWEETNTRNGRIYENHDSLMTWLDGRRVHIQQSMDVTEARLLYQAATLDDLTGLLNRRAGRKALAALLERQRRAGEACTLCMLDIDGLKRFNEQHGHRTGDALMVSVAAALRENTGAEDCVFRVGGDEFLAAFAGLTLGQAARKMEAVQAALDREGARAGLPGAPSFCCGLLELPPGNALSAAEALGAVDEKLYEQKRTAHIRRAEGLLKQAGPGGIAPEDFQFDKERLYEALIRSTDDYIYVSDMKTGTFRYPPSMVEEFDLPAQVIPNAAAVWGAKVHPGDKAAFLESNQMISDGRSDSHCVEYRAQNRKGEWVWLRCRGHLERDAQGEPSLFAGIITNLGKRSRVDHLTGLLNKFEFEDQLSRVLAKTEQASFSILLFGIDGLKHINSLYDRGFGDEVIRIAAQKLQSMQPANSYLYRLDGDEFGVLVRGDDRACAESFYRRVQAAFRHQQTYDGKKFSCTLSCGCVFSPADGASSRDLVKYAHFAMEHAKQQGKNQLCFFSRDLLARRERLLDLNELLRESVENGFQGFELYYQPIILGDGTALQGAEALCRWRCDKYGPVSPVEFIPLLEESGLILPVGRWIFRTAAETCARWQRQMPCFMMGINLSNLQLEDPTFIGYMEETLQKSGANPSNVVVELTESYLASNVAALEEYLGRLRAMRVKISMDDFGTGYSSLGVLKQYPIDVVKIDRTFVKGVQASAFDSAFIQFVVDLCQKLGIQVCLEGVETAEELAVVQPMHLNYYQGFFFGRPISAPEFEARFLPCQTQP